MKNFESILIILSLALGIFSVFNASDIESSIFTTSYLISINILAIYYLLINKTSVYTLLFALTLAIHIGAILKKMHLDYSGIFSSVGLLAQLLLLLIFVVRPIRKKESKDLNFFLIFGIVLFSIARMIIAFISSLDIAMVLNIAILVLIALLQLFSKPKNQMNKFEFDILKFTFITLIIGTMKHFYFF